MSVKIELSPSSKAFLRDLQRSTQRTRLMEGILRIFDRQGALTAGYISKNYLSGQRLNRITGTLARSVVGVGEMFRGLPSMRVGVLTGPALAYAGILEVGTKDYNSDSPFTNDKNGLPLTGIRPRYYIRDGVTWGTEQLKERLEDHIANVISGRGNR